jgi:hypothetical protein
LQLGMRRSERHELLFQQGVERHTAR